MSRWFAAAVSVALLGATLAPVVRSPDDDGFPLSTFPMFAAPRPAQLTMSYALGVAGDGRTRTLSPAQLGTGEVLQAFARLVRAVEAGPEACAALCAAIAARVARDPELAGVVEIRLVTATHDAVAYFTEGARAAEVTRARCDVARGER